MNNAKKTISIWFLSIGVLSLVLSGVWYLYNISQLIDNSEIVKGSIVTYRDNPGSNMKLPNVRYIVENDTFLLLSKYPIKASPKNNIAYINYEVSNPQNAQIYESYLVWGIPLSVAIISVLAIIFAYIMLYFSRK